jgi:GMP synthase-like glutamine amidotransferase
MAGLNIHYFQHVPFEGLGSIEKWVLAKNHVLTGTHFYELHRFPELDNIDWLIVMGGPMGVYDENQYPWLATEKEFITKAIAKGKTVLGICLGAQLIAEVLGAKVYPNSQKEIGWFPIKLSAQALQSPIMKNLPENFSVFHWHGDTFDLPEGALHLAESQACLNQAFSYKEKVLGLQFHFEVDAAAVEGMIEGADAELSKAPFVQTAAEILRHTHFAEQNNLYLVQILDTLECLALK